MLKTMTGGTWEEVKEGLSPSDSRTRKASHRLGLMRPGQLAKNLEPSCDIVLFPVPQRHLSCSWALCTSQDSCP